ncbi:MAG: ECF-type sigma factor [Planctomycetota bacterium]
MVELRFFGGLQVDEVAKHLGISERTVRNEWRVARAWLLDKMSGGEVRHDREHRGCTRA